MKKKVFYSIATLFFAMAIALNMNVLSSGSEKDVSLEGIAVMAKAGLHLIEVLPDVEGAAGARYCWTSVSYGGILTVTPCGTYSANSLPQYKCGSPISFAWNGGSRKQCY